MKILTGSIGMLMHMPFGAGGGGGGDGEEPVKTEVTQEKIDFNARFAASRPGAALSPEEVELAKAGATPPVEKKEGVPPVEAPPARKFPGSNVPKILEEKRNAEKERDELRAKADKFEKEEKPALETKVKELEDKIAAGGHTPAQLQALEGKLAAAETKLAEREEVLVNENKQLRSRLSFHDIQSDPDFQENYVKPMQDAFAEAMDPIRGDDAKTQLLRKALLANSAALSSAKPEERLQQEKERNAVLSQIADTLDDFSKGQFMAAMNAYIRATKEHSAALGEHEKTREEIVKKRGDAMTRQRTEIFSQWTKHNQSVSPTFDPDTEVDEETGKIIKELKLDPDGEVKEAAATIHNVITGQAGMEESVQMLQRGRVYPALKAKLQAREHQIKQLEATIAKLRGTKPAGDSKTTKSEAGPTSREEFNKRFAASRPGGIHG